MRDLASLLVSLVDLRGRCNRRGLLVVATLLLGMEMAALLALWLTGSGLTGAPAIAVKLGFCWLAIAGCAKRLHDLGRSAWAMAWAVPATVVWSTAVALTLAFAVGLEALLPASPWYLVSAGLSMVPVVLATLWLHLARGAPGPNRYGPEPAGLGFSRPAAAVAATPAAAVAVRAAPGGAPAHA